MFEITYDYSVYFEYVEIRKESVHRKIAVEDVIKETDRIIDSNYMYEKENMRSRKVVFITNIPSPYRVDMFYYIQTHIKELDFSVIYTSTGDANRHWSVEQDKVRNSYFLKSKVINIKNDIDIRSVHIPSKIAPVLNKIKPEVVIAMEYNPAALKSLVWCKLHKVPFIHLTDGTLYSERNIGKVQKCARRIICKYADAFIASSTKSKEKLMAWGVDEKEIFVSLLTVDITKFLDMVKKPIPGRILYVGSMVKRKGLDLLIDALSYVEKEYELRIVGNGTEMEYEHLRKLATEKGVDQNIVWCGFKEGEDLIDEYRHAQIFVLPTREDCYGLVILEAMCSGLPIVTSKYADGSYDIVQDGINGYIVDPYDKKDLGSAINKAMDKKEFYEGDRESSCERFSFKNTVEGYLEAISYVNEKRGL